MMEALHYQRAKSPGRGPDPVPPEQKNAPIIGAARALSALYPRWSRLQRNKGDNQVNRSLAAQSAITAKNYFGFNSVHGIPMRVKSYITTAYLHVADAHLAERAGDVDLWKARSTSRFIKEVAYHSTLAVLLITTEKDGSALKAAPDKVQRRYLKYSLYFPLAE
jgi:hypothetical protein